jgi:two-component system, chemotaxis family, protein-glutamate methylesterase/glutaminase
LFGGGLDALVRVLAPLPADLPAALIVLQHLPPDATSQLPLILGRSTVLPVEWAEDGDPIRPGSVLVAPAGQHTLITKDETIALIPSGSVPPYRPSADLLLTTLALAAPRAVAVVLSGEGQDAATGATAVHHFGGTVIVSSLETSARPAMPRATMIRDSITDHVVPLEELAGLLLALTTASLVDPGNGG